MRFWGWKIAIPAPSNARQSHKGFETEARLPGAQRSQPPATSCLFLVWVRLSEESSLRRAVNERGLNSGTVGLEDASSEDEAATATPVASMSTE